MYTYGQRIVSSVKRTVARSLLLDTEYCNNTHDSDRSSVGLDIFSSPKLNEKKKRSRDEGNGAPPPLTPSGPPNSDFQVQDERPRSKRQKHVTAVSLNKPSTQSQSPLLASIPTEVIHLVLSFLNTPSDRFSLQLTCREFQQISNSPEMLRTLNLNGDHETGKGGFLSASESPDQALNRLLKYAVANNLDALYMIGTIKSYCHDGSQFGISILNHASRLGCPRSSYVLGLILRDICKQKSKQYLESAARQGFLPAWQELLPAFEMRRRYGDLEANVLKQYLDSYCLNRFLGSHYIESGDVRKLQTSHCWNPLCGRWAFRVSSNSNGHTNQYPSNTTVKQLRSLLLTSAQIKNILDSLLHEQENNNRALPHRNQSGHLTYISNVENCTKSDPMKSPNQTCSHLFESANSKCTENLCQNNKPQFRVSRMKMCSSCRRAKYCSKLCQVYDWRSGRHKMECQFL